MTEMLKKISVFVIIITMTSVMCGCALNRNVAPQADVANDVRDNEIYVAPEDDRVGIETLKTYPGDWAEIVFDGYGTAIPRAEFEEYRDTGVVVEVVFYLEKSDYYLLGILEGESWAKLYELDNNYISGVVTADKAFDKDGRPLCYAYMQKDGCMSFPVKECINMGIGYDYYSFTFELTPEGIQYLINQGGKAGLGFMTYGVVVTKVIIGSKTINPTIQ